MHTQHSHYLSKTKSKLSPCTTIVIETVSCPSVAVFQYVYKKKKKLLMVCDCLTPGKTFPSEINGQPKAPKTEYFLSEFVQQFLSFFWILEGKECVPRRFFFFFKYIYKHQLIFRITHDCQIRRHCWTLNINLVPTMEDEDWRWWKCAVDSRGLACFSNPTVSIFFYAERALLFHASGGY